MDEKRLDIATKILCAAISRDRKNENIACIPWAFSIADRIIEHHEKTTKVKFTIDGRDLVNLIDAKTKEDI